MEIYIIKNGQQIGPFSEEEVFEKLESGMAKGTDLAWCEGRSDWVPIFEILSIVPKPLELTTPTDSTPYSGDKGIERHEQIGEGPLIDRENGPPHLPPGPANDCGRGSNQDLPGDSQSDSESILIDDLKRKPRSVLWMTVWAFLWPGLGQMLCGQHAKGITLMVTSLFTCTLGAGTGIIPLVIISASAIDAYKVAKRIANGRAVGGWEFFPSEKR